jgi:DNA-binding NtrC family response regulator|uniref:AAA family ATPase n=1 Tax=Desulfurella acetivorans TaxID=33002 RepID=A0A832AEA1_DESAE
MSNDVFMIGNSECMINIFSLIRKIALVDYPVLITGETGTGKELAARAIYERSERSKYSFVSINCSAIPKELFESEIFGHEKGAFTGAHQEKKGLVEIANKGLLFLDEIGDLPLEIQPKLLRLLENSEFKRLGSNSTMFANVRIIAATNKNIEDMVEKKIFREDLYHRLSTFRIHMPPLRDRGDDILVLAKFFINKFSKEMGFKSKEITQEAKTKMLNYLWPGNVRELINRLRRALVFSDNHIISSYDLGLPTNQNIIKPLKEYLWDCEKNALLNALLYSNGNISKVADKLCISRQSVHKLLNKYKIKIKEDKKTEVQEQRNKPRVDKKFNSVLLYNNKEITGYIKNLSSQGYCFVSTRILEGLKGKKCILKIPAIETEIEVVVVRENIVSKMTHLGLSLE